MHKHTNYSFTGGHPLDLDSLEFDRQGLYEAIAAIYADGGSTPMIYSGSLQTVAWLIINGEVLPFTAPSIFPPLSVGMDYYIVINESSSPATFEDITTHNVLDVTRTASVVAEYVISPPDGGVLMSSFVPFHKIFGQMARGAWQNVTGTTSTFDFDISYKKNELTNTLHLKGTVTVKNTVHLDNYYYVLTTLPSAYRPNSHAPFTAFYRFHTSSLKDSTSSDFITTTNGELRDSGSINIGMRRPDTSVTSYVVTFNTIIPLD